MGVVSSRAMSDATRLGAGAPSSKGLRIAVAIALAIGVPAAASADVIVTTAIKSTYACTNAFGPPGCNDASETGTDPYAETLSQTAVSTGGTANSSASQTSNLSTSVNGVTEFEGTGAVSATLAFAPGASGFGQGATGTAALNLWFTLTESYTYVLDGAFQGVTSDLDSANQTRYYFSLYDLKTNTSVVDLYAEGSDADLLARAGALGPGDYFLTVAAFAGVFADPLVGSAAASFSFDLDLTPEAAVAPVAEPASVVLLGTGLLGAGVRRWRQDRT